MLIDALSSHEVRSIPYLGNVPRLRWDGDPQKGIDLLLKETLRHLHATSLLGQCRQSGDYIFARPHELATVVGIDPQITVLYPDRPVGVGEAKRLAKAKIPVVTPFQRLAAEQSLKGQPVALSMSESTDIARHGLDALHLEAACSISRAICSSKGRPSSTAATWARKATCKNFSSSCALIIVSRTLARSSGS